VPSSMVRPDLAIISSVIWTSSEASAGRSNVRAGLDAAR
jgi:hypothetical protein